MSETLDSTDCVDSRRMEMIYTIEDTPPWYLCVFLGLQVNKSMLIVGIIIIFSTPYISQNYMNRNAATHVNNMCHVEVNPSAVFALWLFVVQLNVWRITRILLTVAGYYWVSVVTLTTENVPLCTSFNTGGTEIFISQV